MRSRVLFFVYPTTGSTATESQLTQSLCGISDLQLYPDMSSLRDELLNHLREEIITRLRDDDFVADCKSEFVEELRDRFVEEHYRYERDVVRWELANELYENESDEIRMKVKNDLADEWEPLAEYIERAVREFRSTLKDQVQLAVNDLKKEILEELRTILKAEILEECREDLSDEIRQQLRRELVAEIIGNSNAEQIGRGNE